MRPLKVTSSRASATASRTAWRNAASAPRSPRKYWVTLSVRGVGPRREADEEHVRAGAAGEPRRLGVEEDRAGARRGGAGHRRRHPHRLDRPERRAVRRGHGLERQGLGGRRALGRVARRQPLEAGAEPRQIELAIGDRARRRGPPRSRGECHRRGGARPQPIRRSRSVPAIGLARRPTSFTGPTHDGQPDRQEQVRIVSRARASRGPISSKRRSVRPTPPGWLS